MPFAASTENEINTGQLLQGIVTRIDRTRKVVYLSYVPDTVSKYAVCLFCVFFGDVLFFVLSISRRDSLILVLYCCSPLQTKDVKGISIDLLIPGMMVNARVQSTLENGVMLSFLTYFTGTVSLILLFSYQLLDNRMFGLR